MGPCIVHLGRGAIIVENPPQYLKDGLRRFIHRRGGGAYEDLYSLSKDGKILVSAPGFASRVKRLCGNARVVDERCPMPVPLLGAAISGCETWSEVICKAVSACGGVVSVPDILGFARMAMAVLRAFPRDGLLDRGTPLSVISAKDSADARRIYRELAALLPDREVGLSLTSRYTESEDIIIAPYDAMYDIQTQYAGVLIGDVSGDGNFGKWARNVSAIRTAARWGICSTSFGGAVEIGMDVEGLFGPLVASASYEDAVRAGIGTPVTVVWIPCPAPLTALGSAPFKTLEDMATWRNDSFVKLVADIFGHVQSEEGCLLCTEQVDLARRVSALLPSVVELNGKTPAKERKAALDDLAGGTIRKAIVSSGCFPRYIDHGVMIVVNCGSGEMPGWSIPWRHLKKPGEKTWLVDFRHDWDRHNGRPGRLALNDEARMRHYREMGFSQMTVDGVAQLPF